MLETYLYEATTCQKKGRTCEQPNYEYYDLSSLCFSIYAFALGLSELFFDEFEEYANICPNVKKGSFGAKHAQVRLLFREKFYPAYTKEEDAEKARLGDALVKNISNSYGKEILEEYLAFKREYQENSKFRMEVKYTIGYTTNYVDKSLLSVG